MGEDDARLELEAKAQRLRAKRNAEATAGKRAREDYEAAKERDYRTSSLLRMTWSMSTSLVRWAGLALPLAAGMAYLEASDPERAPSDGTPVRALLGLSVAFVLYVVLGPVRFWLWTKLLPFGFSGGETLGLGGAVTSASLHLHFRGDRPGRDVVSELVAAHLEGAHVHQEAFGLVIAVNGLETGVSNHELGSWLRRAVRKVVKPVHRAYPLERLELVATKVEEFHVPTGD